MRSGRVSQAAELQGSAHFFPDATYSGHETTIIATE